MPSFVKIICREPLILAFVRKQVHIPDDLVVGRVASSPLVKLEVSGVVPAPCVIALFAGEYKALRRFGRMGGVLAPLAAVITLIVLSSPGK